MQEREEQEVVIAPETTTAVEAAAPSEVAQSVEPVTPSVDVPVTDMVRDVPSFNVLQRQRRKAAKQARGHAPPAAQDVAVVDTIVTTAPPAQQLPTQQEHHVVLQVGHDR